VQRECPSSAFLAEEDIGRYTFSGPDGRRWAMNVATMGGLNSMVALDMAITNDFGDFIADGTIVRCYDDFAIVTRKGGDEAHAEAVERIAQRALERGYVFNPSKAILCQQEMDFAGLGW